MRDSGSRILRKSFRVSLLKQQRYKSVLCRCAGLKHLAPSQFLLASVHYSCESLDEKQLMPAARRLGTWGPYIKKETTAKFTDSARHCNRLITLHLHLFTNVYLVRRTSAAQAYCSWPQFSYCQIVQSYHQHEWHVAYRDGSCCSCCLLISLG